MNAIKITVNGEKRLINLDCVEEVLFDSKNGGYCISFVSGNKVLLNEKEFEEFKVQLKEQRPYEAVLSLRDLEIIMDRANTGGRHN